MIDWLSSRPGRLAAFFFLYATEGLPQGFSAVFLVTLMRQEGVSPSKIGAFTAVIILPWSFKWAAGPFVDLVHSRRYGAKRPWICVTQALMIASLAVLALFSALGNLDVTDLSTLSIVLVVCNVFAAIQDVAIDALAVNTLEESERGLANGLMFAGASLGAAVGGSGALYLYDGIGLLGTTVVVSAVLLDVLVFISIWLREPREAAAARQTLGVGRQLRDYVVTALRAFFGSRLGVLGMFLALLPPGGFALGLILQNTLAVELGMSNTNVANLNLLSTVIFSLACICGGLLSDKFGRVRSLAVYIGLTVLPTLALAGYLQDVGWIMPVDTKLPHHPQPPPGVLEAFWAATLAFSVFQGLMYGTRTAFFMDFCDPNVAATQFTAYMALMNLVIAYTSFWQGYAIEWWGYPGTLALDAAAGLVCLPVLALVPWARRRDAADVRQANGDP